ncbi:MAG: acyl carrier protein [Alphaproteobacteria bacterium]|nr:acyl carrier protein [Alphaproteobacteria bacterium]
MPATIKGRVKSYFRRAMRRDDIDDDTDIFEAGVVDSLFAVQLVAFTEQEFGVVVEDDDLDLANFRSVNELAEFVTRKSALSQG